MSEERPEFEANFYGGDPRLPDDEAYVRRVPMVRDPKTWEWVVPVIIPTEQVYFDGTSPRPTGQYVRLMATVGGPVVYRWRAHGTGAREP